MTISNDTKNSLTVTNDQKGTNTLTWNAATFSWQNAGDQTWDSNGYLVLDRDSKNTLSISNDTKN